jgi:XTP/dITP diphosphohydrolase
MKSVKVYFVTNSDFKKKEFFDFVATIPDPRAAGIEFAVLAGELPEILDTDIDRIVTQKALEAFQRIGLPCLVEHSGLLMDALPGLPGGLGQIIWTAIGERMCGFLHPDDSRAATARSVIGHCDGRRVHLYEGETRGQIAEQARGTQGYNWDAIFIPEGSTQTYGEMDTPAKRATAPFYKALSKFVATLSSDDRRVGASR